MLDYAVVIGRFQPFHNGHKAVIEQALEVAKRVIVLIGGDGAPRTIRDPWNYPERSKMILAEFTSSDGVFTAPLKDYKYDDGSWIYAVDQAVESVIWSHGWTDMPPTVGIVVNQDDYSGYTAAMWPDWEPLMIFEQSKHHHATEIREDYFNCGDKILHISMPNYSEEFLKEFQETENFKNLQDEYDYINAESVKWEDSPYPPIFQCVDALVEWGGMVLLVKRKGPVGKGLWALPGGFVNQGEFLLDACVRELKEETQIDMSKVDLLKRQWRSMTFDDPNRSCLGHLITTVYSFSTYFSDEQPKTSPADDAVEVKWFKLDDITRAMMHDDHYYIIRGMLT